MDPSNQRTRGLSRTIGSLAQFISGLLLGFTVTVSFAQLPTASVDGQMTLLDS